MEVQKKNSYFFCTSLVYSYLCNRNETNRL